ncbi:major facilitator superfamily transporter [Drechmeria coniospora]|uniref:Major facilitator superfamily transporter n=1 Tax=Drechmeria coniospora TaxID=98403 RepID=A0A151GQ71_DRECN|nr:major facilitator superfamily transporter [Drechmeria coniospora]KYK59246.1 major facilitator superfamily transporter [Drechmeria coniospora]
MDCHLHSPAPVARPPPVYSPEKSAYLNYVTSESSTPEHTFASLSSFPSHHKAIKFGRGRYSDIELVPQPSDDPRDPLNWSQLRKNLSLAPLLIIVGLVGAMKTAFVTTGGAMAAHYRVSYTAIAALTAVPVIIASLTGFLSSVAAKLWGKRPVYMASTVLLVIGSIWNCTATNSYSSCMGARALQGLGWGAFDTLVMASIRDMYYEHERNMPMSVYNIVSITTTWGFPLIGGVASRNTTSFTVQFIIISAFFLPAIPLFALCASETAFDRSMAVTPPPPAPGFGGGPPWRPWRFRHRFNRETIAQYVRDNVRPFSFAGPKTLPTLLQTPRALFAPTTCLLFLLSSISHGTLWGLSMSNALLVTPLPLALDAANIGTLMTGPWMVGAAVVGGFCFYNVYFHKFTGKVTYAIVAAGTFLVLIGLLTFGLGLDNFMTHQASSPNRFFISEAASQISLPLLSLQLGTLAGGLYTFDAAIRPLLARSASFTSSSIAVAQRSIGDMHAGVVVLRGIAAGIFILCMPTAIAQAGGLKAATLALAIAQVLIAAAAVCLWRFCDETIWRADGKAMGLVDLRLLKQSTSFFDHD